ncbi:MAG: hypothetical protein IT395_00065, partial [Candidatus Omnitrophica bacterium]|nr:hypothetical protein [Candidatus Omnitrophota bacterium]
MLKLSFKSRFSCQKNGQSAVELAIFGSILMFVVAMIFRQGMNGGNFMSTQLKATRYAMSKSFEGSLTAKPGRNNASVLVIEDRLAGDFTNKFGSRDRAPLMASGSAVFTNQMFYPVDKGDCGDDAWKAGPSTGPCDQDVLQRYDMLINGQRFSFTTANFRVITLPAVVGGLAACGAAHPADTRCWNAACAAPGGCVTLYRQVGNYTDSGYAPAGNFDVNFDGGVTVVPPALKPANAPATPMKFMGQWEGVDAFGVLPLDKSLDVDGDFYEEQILDSTEAVDGRTEHVLVIDRQAGDIDFTIDGRRPGAKSGLLEDSEMYSYTQNGTVYRIEEGKLFGGRDDRYIRNANVNDHVDIIERIIQLSNNTGRFCTGNTPNPLVDGAFNPVEACNNCFNAANFQKTCFDAGSLKIFVRSN